MTMPLEEYKSLSDFFMRRLKPEARPVARMDTGGMVSPVDGTVLCCGEIDGRMIEQVKGAHYALEDFLGGDLLDARQHPQSRLYQCVIYLAPGDYHGVHSPVPWNITMRRHFPGYLFPVAPFVVNFIKGLFVLNERVMLSGKWTHGFFSLTCVGATNVGTISLSFDQVNHILVLELMNQYLGSKNEYNSSASCCLFSKKLS